MWTTIKRKYKQNKDIASHNIASEVEKTKGNISLDRGGQQINILLGFDRCMEREKKSTNSGDEPGLCKKLQGQSSLYADAGAISSLSNDCDGGYVPTVGRWGCEWPS